MSESRIEQLLTHPKGFGLPAMPCQRAWCRILDGVPLGELAEFPEVQEMLRCRVPGSWAVKPEQIVGVAGIRTAKSMIGACFAAIRARFCDVSLLGATENPPILPVVSVRKKNARAIVGHLGRLLNKPNFRDWVIGHPRKDLVIVRHWPTGMPIEVQVVAGAVAASNLASYWHASLIVDEVFLLPGEQEARVNLDDVRRASLGRQLLGGQILYEGSPWNAEGPAYELLETYEGRPCEECTVLRANGPSMNPIYWTPERMARMEKSPDQKVRDALTMGGKGMFLSDLASLVSEASLQAVTRNPPQAEILPPSSSVKYTAVIDPATRRNSWTLVLVHRLVGRLIVDLAREWIPTSSERLRPAVVMAEIAAIVRPYRVDSVYSDQWSSDALADIAEASQLFLLEARRSAVQKQRALKRLVEGIETRDRYQFPPDRNLRKDLKQIQRKVCAVAGVKYELRETPDGRHADYAAVLALADSIAFNCDLPIEDRFPEGLFSGQRKVMRPDDPVLRTGVLAPVPRETLRRLGLG